MNIILTIFKIKTLKDALIVCLKIVLNQISFDIFRDLSKRDEYLGLKVKLDYCVCNAFKMFVRK